MSDKEELKKKEEMSVRVALKSIREKVLGEAKKCGRTRVVCSFVFSLNDDRKRRSPARSGGGEQIERYEFDSSSL